MYPHERSLVEKFRDKPFALLGVNSDPRETAKKAVGEENLTWRSWWDGGTTGGPIATQWNVMGWPTIYVLDHHGMIRAKSLNGTALEGLLDELVAEAEASGAGK